MFKALARKGQKKQNFQIDVKMVRLGGSSIDEDICLRVTWKRGPETQLSADYDLNEFEVDAEMNDSFTKVSSFYSKDQVTYEPKFCNFIVNRVDKDELIPIAQVELNMALYCNYTNEHQKVEFESDYITGLFLDVVWTISETDKT